MDTPKKMRLITPSGGSVREGGQWECPVCLLVPSKEIYLCSNGHSVCCLCASKIKECPTCRVEIGDAIKQRNFALEHVLDSLKFECDWIGCNEVMARGDFAKHEEACTHNPNAVKLCHFMGIASCNFQFTAKSVNDVSKIDQVLEHVKSHGYLEKGIKPGDTKKKTVVSFADLRDKRGNNFVKQILTMVYRSKKFLFLQALRIYLDNAGEEVFSIIFVQLTPNSGQEYFTFKLSLKSIPKADAILTWGPASTAKTTWEIKPMKVNQFIEYCNKPASEDPSFPLPLPVSHLEKHYVNANHQIEYGYSISARK